MDTGLKGKVALVTGGARDVGRAISEALAAEGATVAVNYHSSEADAKVVVAAIEKAGGRAGAYRADVADHASVSAMVDRIVADHGRLDILVNNAGYTPRAYFMDSKPEDWRRTVDTCFYGTLNCCHAAIPHMKAAGGGRIVTLMGDSSRVGETGLTLTGAARGGTLAATKSLAKELGPDNITVNALSLGLVATSHTDPAWLEKYRDRLVKMYPLRRLGAVDDIAPAVVFFCGAGAGWITGQVLSISGGYSTAG
jgi:NAD(P)-dependent dehydrogenase (short-subunit alcohol dehydrogenase family)